jgi:uncharacterized secreted protein with C-terminal beta-propeller domain
MPIMKSKPLFVLLASSIVLGACGGGSNSIAPVAAPPPAAPPSTGVLKSAGSGVDACVSLNTEIKAMAEAQVRNSFSSYTTPYYYFGGPAPLASVTSGATASPSPAAASDSSFSTTNIQVAGVDEMDWVKNDGQSLWTFEGRDGQLRLVQTGLVPANVMTKTAEISWPQSIGSVSEPNWLSAEGIFRLSDGKIAAVIGGGSSYFGYWADVLPATAAGSPRAVASDVASVSSSTSSIASASLPPSSTSSAPVSTSIAPFPGPAYSTVPPYTEVRVMQTQGASFEVQQTYTIKGRLLASRRLAASDALVLVTEAPIVWPKGFQWYPLIPANINNQTELSRQWPTLVKNTLDANLKLIQEATLDQWLAQDAPPSQSECAGFVKADAPNRLAVTRIATINPVKKTKTETVVLTEGSGVYANTDALYLTTRRWEQLDGNSWQESFTDLHRFSLSAEGIATYQASGKFSGWLLNRFAMDEIQQGGRAVMRVAVSDRKITSKAPSFSSQPYSYLASFEQQGSKLINLSQTTPIAPGETLQSARFVGEKAYIVTFRNVDPFFVFDLSDPTKLTLKGELKVPGFSTYLHPISDTLVFGLGVDSGTWPRSVKASLYNVSNPALPTEVATQILGDSNSFSEALWEPHALTFYSVAGATAAAGKTTWIAVPVSDGLKLLSVASGDGLKARGAVTVQPDIARRSVFVGDNVYAIGRTKVVAARFDAPSTILGTLSP